MAGQVSPSMGRSVGEGSRDVQDSRAVSLERGYKGSDIEKKEILKEGSNKNQEVSNKYLRKIFAIIANSNVMSCDTSMG